MLVVKAKIWAHIQSIHSLAQSWLPKQIIPHTHTHQEGFLSSFLSTFFTHTYYKKIIECGLPNFVPGKDFFFLCVCVRGMGAGRTEWEAPSSLWLFWSGKRRLFLYVFGGERLNCYSLSLSLPACVAASTKKLTGGRTRAIYICTCTQPPTVECKNGSSVGTLHALFSTFGADLHVQSVLMNEISASELRMKCIKVVALLVG